MDSLPALASVSGSRETAILRAGHSLENSWSKESVEKLKQIWRYLFIW